jgi:hypothetical protein
MDQDGFDVLARRVGSATTRRSAVARLAALGLGALVGGDALAATRFGKKKPKQCGKTTPCPECQQCTRKHKCKAVKNGVACGQDGSCQSGGCVCPAGSFGCGSTGCCANGQACTQAGCGACSPIANFNICTTPTAQCGQFGPNPEQDVCGCVTSVGNAVVCSSGAADCVACTTDADCATALGAPGVCIDISGGCAGCPGGMTKACVLSSCTDHAATAVHAARRPMISIRLRGASR